MAASISLLVTGRCTELLVSGTTGSKSFGEGSSNMLPKKASTSLTDGVMSSVFGGLPSMMLCASKVRLQA